MSEDSGKTRLPRVCVDLDGVLNMYDGWKGEGHFAEPRPGAVEFLQELNRQGFEVEVFTSRDTSRTWAWLDRHHMSAYIETVTQKSPAVAYIDDRAVRFDGLFVPTLEAIRKPPHWKQGSPPEGQGLRGRVRSTVQALRDLAAGWEPSYHFVPIALRQMADWLLLCVKFKEEADPPYRKPRWRGETCKRCGRDQRIAWSVIDELWEAVVPEEFFEETICLECFFQLADEGRVSVVTGDFRHLSVVAFSVEDGGPGEVLRPEFI